MTWRPYLDLQVVQLTGYSERGIPRYATELSRALMRNGVPVAGLALTPHLPFPQTLPRELARSGLLTWNTADGLRRALDAGPTVYHLFAPFELAGPSGWLPANVIRGGMPLAVSVYDLIPQLLRLFGPGSRVERFYRVRERLLARADLLLAISEQTRHDVIERIGVDPERVVVVGAGSSEFFRRPEPSEAPAEVLRQELAGITRPFVLTVAAWDIRKNTELLIDGFAMLPRDLREGLQLVVACRLPPEGIRHWTDRARRAGLSADDVVLTGFVADVVLRALYQQTELFVDPSRYEGFGLPVLEAGRCGAPVIVADTPGLREVLEWRPATFDAGDPSALAGLMERSLTDGVFRSRLHEVAAQAAGRHTWDHVAQRTAAAYERLDHAARRSNQRPPLRVALVGPFSPMRSGIAEYNTEVAAHLGERCELDCFVDAGDCGELDKRAMPAARVDATGRRGPAGVPARWFPARALGRRIDPCRYDAILYTIANSSFHHETLALARRFPGFAWFHDVDLTGLYITYAHRLQARDGPEAAEQLLRDVLARYGGRASHLAVGPIDPSHETDEPYRSAGVCFSIELARSATANIVESEQARLLLELDAGPRELLPAIEVLSPATQSGNPHTTKASFEALTTRLVEIIEEARAERWQTQPKTA